MASIKSYQLANPNPPSSTNKSAQSSNSSINQQIQDGAKEASKHITQIISQAPATAKSSSKPEDRSFKNKATVGHQQKKSAKLPTVSDTTSTTAFSLGKFNFTAQLPSPSTPHEQDKLAAKRHHPTSPPANLVALSNSNISKNTQEDKEDVDMVLTHTEGEKEDNDNNGYTVVGKKMKTTHIVTNTHTSENTQASKQRVKGYPPSTSA